MKWNCLFGRHDWSGCKCRHCGKTRYVPDEEHDWEEVVETSEYGAWYGDTSVTITDLHTFSRCKICGKEGEKNFISQDMRSN